MDREHTANIMKTLHSLRDQGIGTDLTLRCKDGEFSAHSIILLTSDLSGRVKDSRDGIMDLSNGSNINLYFSKVFDCLKIVSSRVESTIFHIFYMWHISLEEEGCYFLFV